MDSIERRIHNAIASTEAEGVTLDQETIDAAEKIARGELSAADYIRGMGLTPAEDM